MAAFKRCPWTPEEDMQLVNYIRAYGIWNWSQMPKHAGLSRGGKSCRLRWMNYLNPKVKRGNYTEEEDELIINMRGTGVGWSAIAARLPGRTDNEIKNRWHTNIKKRIANINIVENMEPNIEQIDTKIEQMELDDFVPLEAPKLQEVDIDYPIFSSEIYNNYEGASSESIAPNLAYGYNNSVIDPHISFWREPFSSEDEFDIDQYATYVLDPEFGMPKPQDWFAAEPFYPYIF